MINKDRTNTNKRRRHILPYLSYDKLLGRNTNMLQLERIYDVRLLSDYDKMDVCKTRTGCWSPGALALRPRASGTLYMLTLPRQMHMYMIKGKAARRMLQVPIAQLLACRWRSFPQENTSGILWGV